MKTLSPALQSHLATGTTTLCWCWKIARADALTLGFTDHDVPLSFDGVTYEIDLGKKNRARLERALAPFIEAGRRAPRGGRRRGGRRPAGSPVDRSAVRAWARAAGLKVSERGRISADIMSQYDAAH